MKLDENALRQTIASARYYKSVSGDSIEAIIRLYETARAEQHKGVCKFCGRSCGCYTPEQPVGLPPTDAQLTRGARAIGNSMREANHYQRAKEVWDAFHTDKEVPIPNANYKCEPTPMREVVEAPVIPKGWYFYTADFSVENRPGRITLKRDAEGAKWWHSLTDADQEITDLFLGGSGNTVDEAIADAITHIKVGVSNAT